MASTVQFKGTSLTHDLNGMTLTWNQKGQITNATGAAAGDISYTYDALGRRVQKIVNSVTTNYLYDGLNLIAELDGDNSNAPIAWYVYAGPMAPITKPLVRIAADGTRHFQKTSFPRRRESMLTFVWTRQDKVNVDPRLRNSGMTDTDASGSVTTRYNYSPFGETEVTHLIGTEINQPFRFTGREYDPETGFYHFLYKEYSPEMRRFISEDPIRFAAGDVNWYAYVGGNPVNFTDPLGLAAGDPYDTMEDAAFAALDEIYLKTKSTGLEHAGWIYRISANGKSKYTYSEPKKGSKTPDGQRTIMPPKPDTYVADYHSHPYNISKLSVSDIDPWPGYLITVPNENKYFYKSLGDGAWMQYEYNNCNKTWEKFDYGIN